MFRLIVLASTKKSLRQSPQKTLSRQSLQEKKSCNLSNFRGKIYVYTCILNIYGWQVNLMSLFFETEKVWQSSPKSYKSIKTIWFKSQLWQCQVWSWAWVYFNWKNNELMNVKKQTTNIPPPPLKFPTPTIIGILILKKTSPYGRVVSLD